MVFSLAIFKSAIIIKIVLCNFVGVIVMAPTISVSDEVYDALKRRSKSWEDTPGKIIAELLGIDEKSRAPIRRKNRAAGSCI